MSHSSKYSSFTLLCIAALLQTVWGLVPVASKFVIDEIPNELYIALRWSISGLIFLVFLMVTRTWSRVSLKSAFSVALLGVLGYGIASLGTLYGLKMGGVTNFALMSALSPVVTALVSIAQLKERPNRFFLLAMPLSLAGLLFLIIGKYNVSSLGIAAGSAVCILAGYTLEAMVFVYSKKFKSAMSIAQYLAMAQLSAAAFMWLAQLTAFHQVSKIENLSLNGLCSLFFVAVIACVLCYALLYWLLKYIEGHKLALFDGFHALSAAVFGVWIFNEALTQLMVIGGVLILAGLVLGNLPQSQTSAD
jgi:drug/metabolite transporter (DMT)-like permease